MKKNTLNEDVFRIKDMMRKIINEEFDGENLKKNKLIALTPNGGKNLWLFYFLNKRNSIVEPISRQNMSRFIKIDSARLTDNNRYQFYFSIGEDGWFKSVLERNNIPYEEEKIKTGINIYVDSSFIDVKPMDNMFYSPEVFNYGTQNMEQNDVETIFKKKLFNKLY